MVQNWLNSPKVTQKVLVFQKVARSCSLTKKLLKILKVAAKLPCRIWIGQPPATTCKPAIILKDIAGEEIYNSRKYQFGGSGVRGNRWSSSTTTVTPGQKNSASHWRGESGYMRATCGRVTRDNPAAVWLLEEGRKLNITQFVLEDGLVFRAKESHESLIEACLELGDEKLSPTCITQELIMAPFAAFQRNKLHQILKTVSISRKRLTNAFLRFSLVFASFFHLF